MNNYGQRKFKDRLLGGSFMADPARVPTATQGIASPEEDYGVSLADNGNVVIHLGMVPPFEVPKQTAIKLAMLLLKQAGVKVDIDG